MTKCQLYVVQCHGSLLKGTLKPEPKAQAPEFSRASEDAQRKRSIRLIVQASSLFAQRGVNEIVIFSIGSRSAMSIACEENFILAKNLPLDGTKPGLSRQYCHLSLIDRKSTRLNSSHANISYAVF